MKHNDLQNLTSLLKECLDSCSDFNEDDPSEEMIDLADRIKVACNMMASPAKLANIPVHPYDWYIEKDELIPDEYLVQYDDDTCGGCVGIFPSEEEAKQFIQETVLYVERITA